MSNYANTKATIAANVYENHLNQVTANMAKAAINAVVDALIAGGFLYKGVATTSTNPGSPDANVFYIATAPGTYTNFGSLVVADGEVAILKYNGSWTKEVTGAATAAEVTALGHEVDEIRSDVDEQNQEIADFKETITNQIDNFQPIVIEGDVVNAPDEEDITTDENDLLKFANRGTLHGMGYVILRRGKTFAEQVTLTNTIYEIRYNFDLGGASVTIPAGCVLKFVGGRLADGCIVGNGTTIIAPDEKIFVDVALFQCCFSAKAGSYGESNTILPWIDVATRKVECNVTGKSWKIRTSGAIRFSNADGLGEFVKFDGTNNYLESDRELLLQDNPGSFWPVNNGTSFLTISKGTLNEAKVLTLHKEADGVSLIIPSYSRWAFFGSNNANDDPNSTYLAPGTVVDLSQTTIYCTYLNRVMFDISHSTFNNKLYLSWFVGDDYARTYSSDDLSGISDRSKEVQMALDGPMDIVSNIRGIIKLSKTIYAETKKRIDLGGKYWVAGKEEWAINSKQSNKFNFICTAFASFVSGSVFVIRNSVDIFGGLFTTNFYNGATKSILVIDGDYYSSECDISTSLIGTRNQDGTFNCDNGILFDYENKIGGYNYFSKFKCDVSYCKYGLYSDYNYVIPDCHINTADIDLVVWGYYEGIRMRQGSSCHIRAILQANACVPLSDIDNYRNFVITAPRSVVDIVPWDWSVGKTSAAVQKPYLPPVIGGARTIVAGTSAMESEEIVPIIDSNYYGGPNPIIEEGDGYGIRTHHIRIENVFANLENDTTTLKSAAFYYRKFKVKDGHSVDVSAYSGRCLDSADFDTEVISSGFSSSSAVFSMISDLPNSGVFNTGEFAEIYFEANPDYTMDFGVAWQKFALSFKGYPFGSPWKYAKVIVGNESTFPLRSALVNIEQLVDGMTYFKGSFGSLNINITKLLIRCFCGPESGYGVPSDGISGRIPKFVGWSAHSSFVFLDRYTQVRRVASTASRPTKNLFKGMMIYDSTLNKPIWYKGSGVWVDATGASV